MKKESFAIKRGDVMVAAIILLLAVGALLFSVRAVNGAVLTARLRIDGRTMWEEDVGSLVQNVSFRVESEGYYLIIEAERGRVRVAVSNCPDGACVRTGWLMRPGAVSACVPARAVLELSGDVPEVDVMLR